MRTKNKLPKVGSYQLQKRFPLPVGRIKKSSGIYKSDRFNELKRCVQELWEMGRTDDLIKLKEGKISCIQLLTAWKDRSLYEMDWDSAQERLWNAYYKWLSEVEIADVTHRVYYNTIGRLKEFANQDDATVSDLPQIIAKYKILCGNKKSHFSFQHARLTSMGFARDLTPSRRDGLLYKQIKAIPNFPKRLTRRPTPNKPFGVRELSRLITDVKVPDYISEHIYFMCLHGLGAKEYLVDGVEEFPDASPPHLLVKGTKAHHRYRKIPLMVRLPEYDLPTNHQLRWWLGKMDGRQVYDCRRTYATWLDRSGISRRHASAYMGHAVQGMTELYQTDTTLNWIQEDYQVLRDYLQTSMKEVIGKEIDPVKPPSAIAELGKELEQASMEEIKEYVNDVLTQWRYGKKRWMHKHYRVTHLEEVDEWEKMRAERTYQLEKGERS